MVYSQTKVGTTSSYTNNLQFVSSRNRNHFLQTCQSSLSRLMPLLSLAWNPKLLIPNTHANKKLQGKSKIKRTQNYLRGSVKMSYVHNYTRWYFIFIN